MILIDAARAILAEEPDRETGVVRLLPKLRADLRRGVDLADARIVETHHYTCVRCGRASLKDAWGPGRITCPRCGAIAPSPAELEAEAAANRRDEEVLAPRPGAITEVPEIDWCIRVILQLHAGGNLSLARGAGMGEISDYAIAVQALQDLAAAADAGRKP